MKNNIRSFNFVALFFAFLVFTSFSGSVAFAQEYSEDLENLSGYSPFPGWNTIEIVRNGVIKAPLRALVNESLWDKNIRFENLLWLQLQSLEVVKVEEVPQSVQEKAKDGEVVIPFKVNIHMQEIADRSVTGTLITQGLIFARIIDGLITDLYVENMEIPGGLNGWD